METKQSPHLRRVSVSFGLLAVVGLAVSLVAFGQASAKGRVTAQAAGLPTITAELRKGTCSSYEKTSSYQTTMPTPAAAVTPAAGQTAASTATAGSAAKPEAAVPVDAVIADITVKLADLAKQPNAIVVFSGAPTSGTVVACGEVTSQGGKELVDGLRGAGGSGWVGLALLRERATNPNETELRVFLMRDQDLMVTGVAAPAAAVAPSGQAATAMTVDLTDTAVSPTTLSILANTPVKLTLRNTGKSAHNFNVEALNVHSGDIQPGKTMTITIDATKAGTFQFDSTANGQPQSGLVGQLIVK